MNERSSTQRTNVLIRVALLLLLTACSSEHKPTTIFGEWKGMEMTVSDTVHHESVTIPAAKYGYVKLLLRKDSSFEFDIGVLKDVQLERSVLGVPANVVLLKAVYTSSRFGTFRRSDSTIVLSSKDGAIFVTVDTETAVFRARFSDHSNRNWLCTLIPNE